MLQHWKPTNRLASPIFATSYRLAMLLVCLGVFVTTARLLPPAFPEPVSVAAGVPLDTSQPDTTLPDAPHECLLHDSHCQLLAISVRYNVVLLLLAYVLIMVFYSQTQWHFAPLVPPPQH